MNTKKLLGGALIALGAVLASGFLTPLTTGLSYDRFTWTVYAAIVYPATETGDLGAAACSDGIDNDNNGLTDCADPDCAKVIPCGAPVPLLSRAGLLLLVVVFAMVGLYAVRARRQRT